MSLHCLRDAVDVKPDLMVSNAADIVEKYLQIMATDHDDKSNRNVSRASQNAAMALLRNMSIWASLSILANHVSEPVPVGRDSIDLCRLLVEDKKQIMTTDNLNNQCHDLCVSGALNQPPYEKSLSTFWWQFIRPV